MKNEAIAHWNLAKEDLLLARRDLSMSPRAAVSRAYYAVFHAVSALFALEDRVFSRHTTLESAVHKELVKTNRWPTELGADYSKLFKLRMTSDYDVMQHVSGDAAVAAISAAERILDAVRASYPELE